MSNVKYKNTKPEILVRKALFKKGFRYRINVKNLAGHPDIVLKKYKSAVFVNGCFWHGHENCLKATMPKTNTVFWKDKITGNRHRDEVNRTELENKGWNVFVVWECQLKKDVFDKTIDKLVSDIKSSIGNLSSDSH